jgi:hypothetical protein
MAASAFEVLVAPVLWGTLGAYVAGAAIFALKNLADALVGRLGRMAQSFKVVPGAVRNRRPRSRRSAAHGVGSIG